MPANKSNHGGARTGSGRKPVKEKKKVKSLRLLPHTISLMEKIEKLYVDPDTACSKGIEGFLVLRHQSLLELEGIFTKKELMALYSSQSGFLLNPSMQISTEVVVANLEDFYASGEGSFNQDGVDNPAFYEKIRRLSSAHVFYLQDEIARIWSNVAELEPFLDKLSKKPTST